MNEKATALIRQGALTTIGALAVYGVLALTVTLMERHRKPSTAAAAGTGGCACGGAH